MEPIFSIFIPTYNRFDWLRSAIRSALNQTFRNLQVIVCDNASEDRTEEVVRELQKSDKRLVYYRHPTNIGMMANYHFALSCVSTPFFSFLSDDDWLLPNFCELAVAQLKGDPEIAFFASSSVIVSPARKVLRVPLSLWQREGRYSPEEGVLELVGKYPIPTTVAFRSSLAASLDLSNPVAWDCDYLLQLAAQHPFVISKEICGLFRQHSASYSFSQQFRSTYDSIEILMRRARQYPFSQEDLKERLQLKLQKDLRSRIRSHILNCLSRGDWTEARAALQGNGDGLFILYGICRLFPPFKYLLAFLKRGRFVWIGKIHKFRSLSESIRKVLPHDF